MCVCIFLFLIQWKCKRLTSIFFVTTDSNRKWQSDYTNTLVPDLAFFVILSALSRIVWILIWAHLTLQHMSKICSPSASLLITPNFSSILIVFHQFFTCIALGDVGLHFSLIFIAKANDYEGGITCAACLHHQCRQSLHTTDGVIVTSLSASLQHIFHSCQVTLNQKLSRVISA